MILSLVRPPATVPRADRTGGGRVGSPRRHGYTLIELLAVVAVILILATISLRVMGNALGMTREKRTQALILKLHKHLQQRREAFERWSRTTGEEYYSALAEAQYDATLAKVLQRKKLAEKYFPQRYAESTGRFSDGSPQTPARAATAESGELLYQIIVNGETFGASPVDDGMFQASEIGDVDGDGNKEFLDGWGEPLRFYRWPTRLIRPAPSGQTANAQGATAPSGMTPGSYTFTVDRNLATYLYGTLPPLPPSGAATNWTQEASEPLAIDADDLLGVTSQLSASTSPFTVSRFEAEYHTPATYHAPLIISAGPDRLLGLYEPGDTTNFGYLCQPQTSDADHVNKLVDNLTNYNRRAGG